MNNIIFPDQTKFSENKPFLLEFKQLKEYYNFRRKFKEYRSNENLHGKPIQNVFYLIDRNWLNKWKECVGFQQFQSLGLERDLTDKDYLTFMMFLNRAKKKEKLIPLDNSNIYKEDGRINPLAKFVIINKKCHEIFKKSRQNMVYNITETSVPLKFLKDKIILHITGNIKIIFFKNDVNNADEEIILIFLEDQEKTEIKDKEKNDNKNKAIKESILAEIDKEDFKDWLKNRYFEMDGPDELEINEKGCKIKIINKNLKLKGKNLFQNNDNNTKKSEDTNPLIGFININQKQDSNPINEFQYVNYMRESMPKENIGNLNTKKFNNNNNNYININLNLITNKTNNNNFNNNNNFVLGKNNNNFNNNGFNNNINNFNNNNFFSANAVNNNFNNNFNQNRMMNNFGINNINNIKENNTNNMNNMNLNNNNNFNNSNNKKIKNDISLF